MDMIEFKLGRYGANTLNITTTTAAKDLFENAQLLATTIANTINDDRAVSPTADSELSRFARPLLTIAAILTLLIMGVGIIGNLLTIVALLKCPKVRNVAAAFIISLCVADCLFCLIVLPFSAFRFIQGTWTHGDFLCTMIPFIQYGNVGVSLLCIGMITINRYIMIAHHSMYARIYKRHWIALMIAFCWIFAYGMQLPTLFKVWGAFGYDANLGTCSILTDANGRSSKTALFVIAFVFPCLIIIGCYARIFWVVHKSEQRLRKHSSMQNTIPNNMRPPPGVTSAGNNAAASPSSNSISSGKFSMTTVSGHHTKATRVKDQRDVKAKRNEWRITKMVLAIFLSFVLCYLPITLTKVADKDVRYPGFHILGYIMLYLSSCINPIIYVIMNKQYRQAYKTVIMCKTPRMLSFTQAAGSSLGEKWKDIGYSYNHSRTMVSQVSVTDTQPVPLAPSHQENIMRPTTNPTGYRISTLRVIPEQEQISQQHQIDIQQQQQSQLNHINHQPDILDNNNLNSNLNQTNKIHKTTFITNNNNNDSTLSSNNNYNNKNDDEA